MEQRNLLLAIVLSVGIMIAFQFFFERMHPVTPTPQATTTQTVPNQTVPAPGSEAQNVTPPGTAAPSGGAPATAAGAAATGQSRSQALAGQRVKIETPRAIGSINLTGGRIDDLSLTTYHDTIDPKSPDVVLLNPVGTGEGYFAQFGWVAQGDGIKVPAADTAWTSSGGTLTPKTPVTLTWDNGAGLVFTREISVDDAYMFTVKDSVKNSGTSPVSLLPYALVSRTGTPQVSGYYILFEGLVGELDGAIRENKYSALTTGKPVEYDSKGGWVGFTDKYWLTAVIPPQGDAIKGRFSHQLDNNVDRYQADYLGTAVTVAPGATGDTSTRFFAGAKELNLLETYTNAGIPLFDYAIDFGWFWFLTKPIFRVLLIFEGMLGNFGLAILLLTFLIKLAFFPLANKSYNAMAKMRLLQPEMQKIRERFPDDKARQQQEIMAMYKKVGAHPLAGCLPIVIQIPVFFSLYKVLFVTIEMRHAPFFGWIHDLSAPDPTSFANLFGLLPFAPPAFLMIGAWPLIMGLTMFLQQKL
ncbi:MAG: membrane protein insertase YidC, partial [Alphaproteobacteria bacterium]|nr:membrane protein insertase YidC [Alphaproteobacteria bacterium]